MKVKTTVIKEKKVNRRWHLIDLSGQNLGRISVKIASLLIGKDKPSFSYHRDDGDYVVAINASQIEVTGNKLKQKVYYHHTNYAGNLKEFTLKDLLSRDARKVIIHSVSGMLPKNKLRSLRLARLKVFLNSETPYGDKIK